GLGLGIPRGQRADVIGSDVAALGAQQVLEQDLQTIGQSGHIQAVFSKRIEPKYLVRLAIYIQRIACAKAVRVFHRESSYEKSGSDEQQLSSYTHWRARSG